MKSIIKIEKGKMKKYVIILLTIFTYANTQTQSMVSPTNNPLLNELTHIRPVIEHPYFRKPIKKEYMCEENDNTGRYVWRCGGIFLS